jgi:transposase-like protein
VSINRGRFVKGQHWRKPQPFWKREWLDREYTEKRRSAGDIARQFGVTENAILFWLSKLGVPRRTMSEIRQSKRWGATGEKNPMHGRTGRLNPNWKGGLTPARQAVYASSEWKRLARDVRRRDKVCRLCESGESTEVHHIDPFSQSPLLVLDIGNVILLCAKCHRKITHREQAWKKRLFALLGGGDESV